MYLFSQEWWKICGKKKDSEIPVCRANGDSCLILFDLFLHFMVHWKDFSSSRSWLFHHWNGNASCCSASWYKIYRRNLRIYYSKNYKTDSSPEILSGEKVWEKPLDVSRLLSFAFALGIRLVIKMYFLFWQSFLIAVGTFITHAKTVPSVSSRLTV